jgi:ligand-binding sensor domain-containing protein
MSSLIQSDKMKTLNSPKKTQNKTTLIGSSLSIIALLILLIANQTIATNKSNKVESDTQFTTSNSDLPSNEIKAIYVDSVNVAWIGTDAGLSRYNGQNWTTYTTSDLSIPMELLKQQLILPKIVI